MGVEDEKRTGGNGKKENREVEREKIKRRGERRKAHWRQGKE